MPPGYLYAFMASPYAQLQIDALIYGSVIQGVYEKDFSTILIFQIDASCRKSEVGRRPLRIGIKRTT